MRKLLDIDRAAEMWAAGATATEIATEINGTRSSVLGLADRNRDRFPPRREGGRSLAETAARMELVDRAVALVEAGRSRKTIAKELGVKPSTLQGWIQKSQDRFSVAEQHAEARRGEQRPAAPPSTKARSFARPVRAIVRPDAPVAAENDAPALEFVPAMATAFRPLPGSIPVQLASAIGCRWPVHAIGDPLRDPTTLVCDEPKAPSKTPYCCTHLAMSRSRGTVSERAALNGVGGRA